MSEPENVEPTFSSDVATYVSTLREIIRHFVSERNWSQFHAPKNLAMSLAIESAELMEHFQWIEASASRRIALNQLQIDEIAEELADVFAYCLALANELDIDLSSSFQKKMVKNRLKYPADEYRGRY